MRGRDKTKGKRNMTNNDLQNTTHRKLKNGQHQPHTKTGGGGGGGG